MPRTLRLFDNGGDVIELQDTLNCAGPTPTRMPKLKTDGDFGVFTKARVMEFQFNRKLEVDGVVGPITHKVLATIKRPCANPPKPLNRCVLVNLVKNNMFVFLNGVLQFKVQKIRGGSATDPSTQGVFFVDPLMRFRHHTSSKFPEPPDNMQFSLFYITETGEAIHQGPSDAFSHGCIHVDEPDAERVFKFAGKASVMVIVVKERK